MSIFPTNAHRFIPLFLIFILILSCSKDSDLLADYVIPGTDGKQVRLVVDDSFFVSRNSTSILDVLRNDAFDSSSSVTIVGTSTPNNGTVEINEDNTISYTSDSDGTDTTDSFTYTAEVTDQTNSTTTEQGTVTVKLTGDNIYYVTLSGKSTNDGKSESSAWTLSKAFKSAIAGDIVYIKAGNYGNLELIVENSGLSGKPIKFIGYKETPGDIVSNEGPTFTFEDYKSKSNNLDHTKMPLLQGIRTNDIGQGRAIEIRDKKYVHIENLMIQKYEYGLYGKGDYITLKNIISSDHGDFNASHSYPDGTSDLHMNLSGNGFWITGSTNVLVSDCLAINNGARGIAVIGTENSTIAYSKVYSDNHTNPTDYYFMIYNSSNNTLNYCEVERIGQLSHPGHGFSLKVDAAYNELNNCIATGTSFELNNRVNNNTFNSCHVQGTGEPLSGGWEITNYSHDNVFNNCSNDSGEGIVFADWIESDGNNGINSAGFNNTFKNCTITNVVEHSGAIIDFNWNNQSGRLTSSAKNNIFIDCTFSGAKSLFKVDRVNSGNQFINCSISDIDELRHSRYSENENIPLDIIFENPLLNNLGFNL